MEVGPVLRQKVVPRERESHKKAVGRRLSIRLVINERIVKRDSWSTHRDGADGDNIAILKFGEVERRWGLERPDDVATAKDLRLAVAQAGDRELGDINERIGEADIELTGQAGDDAEGARAIAAGAVVGHVGDGPIFVESDAGLPARDDSQG